MRRLLGMLLSTPAFAGIIVSGNVTQNGTPAPLKQMYQDQNARLEFRAGPGAQHDNWLVYRGGTGQIAVVDSAKKSYLELHENDVQRIGGFLSAFPGAKKSGPKPKPGDLVFKKGSTEKVGKWKCTHYTILNKGHKNGKVCVVPFTEVGATSADFKPLAALAKTFSSLGPIAPSQSAFLGWGIDQALNLGFMVEIIGYDPAGKEISKLAVDTVKREPLDESVFANPKDFTRNDVGGLLQNLMMGKPPSGK